MSPPDSRGRRFGDLSSEPQLYDLFANELASPLRDSFLFTVQGSALRDPRGGNGTLLGDVYQTIRTSTGWHVARHVTPTGVEAFTPNMGGVSADHEYAFVFVPELLGGTNGLLGEEKDYLGDSTGHFELTGIGSLGSEPFAQGRYISPGGEHVIFSTGHQTQESGWCGANQQCRTSKTFVKKLEPEAPGNGTGVVYDRSADGPTRVVSLLPGDVAPASGENATYQGASADGSSIAFMVGGVLYVRSDGEETIEVAAGAPTFAGLSVDGSYLFYVSGGNIHRFNTTTESDEEANSTGDGEMVNAALDGSRLYFISRQALTGSEENDNGEVAVPIAKGEGELSAATGSGTLTAGSTVVTAVNATDGAFAAGMLISGFGVPDGTTITEVSPGTLTLSDAATASGNRTLFAGSTLITGVDIGEGTFLEGMEIAAEGIPSGTTIVAVGPGSITLSAAPTKSGTVALTGASPNLYVWSGTSPRYVATVDPADADRVPGLTAWASHAVAPIDGPGRGPGADPSRTSADGGAIVFESRARLTSYDTAGHTEIYRYDDEDRSLRCISCSPLSSPAVSNARLGDYGTLRRTTIINNVSADGKRVFFETAEALVPADINGINDIYQWQLPGEEDPPVINLISSGISVAYPQEPQVTPPRPNILLGVSPDGSDVFFLAQEALVAGAPGGGASAIYDARIDGGFAAPPPPVPPCIGGLACHGEGGPAPSPEGAPSQTIAGSGNVKPAHKRHRCTPKHRKSGPKHRSCHRKKARGGR
ncbi:MAG TPA: hypothetical protein VFX35_00520 [Solirubrobacterales bacterium]|nr:hypothetical protein [Solirubrobacterales bacterium]